MPLSRSLLAGSMLSYFFSFEVVARYFKNAIKDLVYSKCDMIGCDNFRCRICYLRFSYLAPDEAIKVKRWAN